MRVFVCTCVNMDFSGAFKIMISYVRFQNTYVGIGRGYVNWMSLSVSNTNSTFRILVKGVPE